MSQHLLPEPNLRHCRRAFAILCAFAAVGGLASAAEPPMTGAKAPVTTSNVPGLNGMMLERSALAALDADKELRKVNIVVSVVEGIAVIGGPVSNERQAQRAEQLIRAVPGIVDVRNTCFVVSRPDPLWKSVAERFGTSLPPRPKMPELPGVLSNHLTPATPVSAPSMPPPPANTNVASTKPTGATVVALKPQQPTNHANSLLGGPVRPGRDAKTSSSLAPPALGTEPVQLTAMAATGNAKDVLAAIGEVQKTEKRFAELTVDLRNGTLAIGGTVPQASDAWDFARKVQTVPGVARIAVGAVAAK